MKTLSVLSFLHEVFLISGSLYSAVQCYRYIAIQYNNSMLQHAQVGVNKYTFFQSNSP